MTQRKWIHKRIAVSLTEKESEMMDDLTTLTGMSITEVLRTALREKHKLETK